MTLLRFPVDVELRRGRPQVRRSPNSSTTSRVGGRRAPLRVMPVISAQYREPSGWRRRLRWAGPPRTGSDRRRGDGGVRDTSIVVLPGLTNIEQMEVEVWADESDVRRVFGDRDPVPVIRRMFEDTSGPRRNAGCPWRGSRRSWTICCSRVLVARGGMKLGFYTAERRPAGGHGNPAPAASTLTDPAAYIPDDSLVDAVKVARIWASHCC